jgi:hypothetical protein
MTEKPSPPPQQPGLGQNHVPPNPRGPNGRHAVTALLNQNQPENNYSSQGSYGGHAQGTAINSLHVEPAQLRPPQDGYQQAPTTNNIFQSDSQPVFQHFQQTATQGALNQQGQGQPPPNRDGESPNAAPRYADMFEEFTHMYSPPDKYAYQPSMPYYDLDSYLNTNSHGAYGSQPFSHINPVTDSKDNTNSHGAYDFQPFSHIDDVTVSKGNNYLPVYTQHDGGKPAAPPHMPISELVNSNEDQSSVIASAAQESTWPSDDAHFEMQRARKRDRSTRDNSGSIDKEVETLREAQPLRSQTQRNPAKKPRNIAPKLSIEDQDTLQSNVAQPVLQAQNPQLLVLEKTSRRESRVAADYSGVKIAPDKLRRMSREEARDICARRLVLAPEVEGDDNVDEVKADPDKWIRAIMDTLDAPYNNAPETKTLTPEKLLVFQRWQKEHYAITMEYLNEHVDSDLTEASATVLYYMVVEAHEMGFLIKSSGTSFKHDQKATCKDRMEKIIAVLKALTIVRKDLVFGDRLTELVANPWYILKRKEENKKTDGEKDDTKKANKKAKNDQAKAGKKATKAKKQGANGNAHAVDSDERSTSVSSENLKAAGTRASSDADRSASFDRNDSISVPSAISVDDGETGVDQGSLEEGEDSSADD